MSQKGAVLTVSITCPKCRESMKYEFLQRKCAACGYHATLHKNVEMRLPAESPVWLSSEAGGLPAVLKPVYERVRDAFVKGSAYISCAVVLEEALRQAVCLPVLMGAAVIRKKNKGFTLPLSGAMTAGEWIPLLDSVLHTKEMKKCPDLVRLLQETVTLAHYADSHAMLNQGALSGRGDPKNLMMVLERLKGHLRTVAEGYAEILPVPGKEALTFTMAGKTYPVPGAFCEGGEIFLPSHAPAGGRLSCFSLSGGQCRTTACPEEFVRQEAEEERVRPVFSAVPHSPVLLTHISRKIGEDFSKGVLFVRAGVELGLPQGGRDQAEDQLTLVFDARRSGRNNAAALFERVSGQVRLDAKMWALSAQLDSGAMAGLLTGLRRQSCCKVVLLVANAEAFSNDSHTLSELLPKREQLSDGVYIAVHSADPDFSYKGDRTVLIGAQDSAQETFLAQRLKKEYRPRTLQLPAKKNEDIAKILAAANGDYGYVSLAAAFARFAHRPDGADLYGASPAAVFDAMARELYGDRYSAFVKIVLLCATAAAPGLLGSVLRMYPEQNPSFVRAVFADTANLDRYHIRVLIEENPEEVASLCGGYARVLQTSGSAAPQGGYRFLSNAVTVIKRYGSESQKRDLASPQAQATLLSAADQISGEASKRVRRQLYESVFGMKKKPGGEKTEQIRVKLMRIYEDLALPFLALCQGEALAKVAEPGSQEAWEGAAFCAEIIMKAGQHKRALHILEGVLSASEPEKLDQVLSFRVHALRGNLLYKQGANEEAEKAFRFAFAGVKKAGPEKDAHVRRERCDACDRFGELLRAVGKTEEALTYFRQSSALRQSEGDDVKKRAVTELSVSSCLAALGRREEALAAYESAESLLAGAASPVRLLAHIHTGRADLYSKNGNAEAALSERMKAVDCYDTLYTAGKETTVPLCAALQHAAADAVLCGKADRAVRYLDIAIELCRKMTESGLVPDDAWLGELRGQRAERQAIPPAPAAPERKIVQKTEPKKEAVKPSRRESEPRVKTEPVRPPVPMRTSSGSGGQHLDTLRTKAFALLGAQRLAEAAPVLEKLIGRLRADSGRQHEETLAHALSGMGMVHRSRGELERALACYTEAIEICGKREKEGLSVDANRFANARLNRALIYADREEYPRAVKDLQKAVILREGMSPPDLNSLARLYLNLAFVHAQEENLSDALACNRKVVEIRARLYKEDKTSRAELARGYMNLGILLGGEKRLEEELRSYSSAIDLLEEQTAKIEEEHELLIKLYRYRAMTYETAGDEDAQKNDLQRVNMLEAAR